MKDQNQLKEVIVFPIGQVSPLDRNRLNSAGYVVVEAEDPPLVRVLAPGPGLLTSDDLLAAALHAMATSPDFTINRIFVQSLNARMRNKEQEKP